MGIRNHNPGCPCCDCHIITVEEEETAVLQNWSIKSGVPADVSAVYKAIQLDGASEILNTDTHPYSPYGMQVDVDLWADATGEPVVLIGMSSDATDGIVVKFSGFTAAKCGEIQVFKRVSGVETLLAHEHVTDPLPYLAWHAVSFCWDHENYQLTITLPNWRGRESTFSSAPGNLAKFTTAVPGYSAGRYIGLGCTAGVVRFRNLAWKAKGVLTGKTCEECSPSCLLGHDDSADATVTNATAGSAVVATGTETNTYAATASSNWDTEWEIEEDSDIDAYLEFTVNEWTGAISGAPAGQDEFATNLAGSYSDDYFNSRTITMLTGNAANETKTVNDYTGLTGTIETTVEFVGTLADGDAFKITPKRIIDCGITGRLHQASGSGDSVAVSAYNWITSAWTSLSIAMNGVASSDPSDNVSYTATLLQEHVSPFSSTKGKVRIRFHGTSLTSGTTLFVDEAWVSYYDELSTNAVRDVWTKTGTWINNISYGYHTSSNPGTLTHRTLFDATAYIIHIEMYYFGANDTARIILNSAGDYVELYMSGGGFVLSVNGTTAAVTAHGTDFVTLTACVTQTHIYAQTVNNAFSVPGAAFGFKAIAWTKPTNAFQFGVRLSSSDAAPVTYLHSASIRAHESFQSGCGGCWTDCSGCTSEQIFPDTLYLDFGTNVVSGPCADCDLFSGIWPLWILPLGFYGGVGTCYWELKVETDCNAGATAPTSPNKEFCEALNMYVSATAMIGTNSTGQRRFCVILQMVFDYHPTKCVHTLSWPKQASVYYLSDDALDCDDNEIGLHIMTAEEVTAQWPWGSYAITPDLVGDCDADWPLTLTLRWTPV